MGSGGAIDWGNAGGPFDWARRFHDDARSLMQDAPGDVTALAGAPRLGARRAHPDHFIPLVYVAGLAAESACAPSVLVDGHTSTRCR